LKIKWFLILSHWRRKFTTHEKEECISFSKRSSLVFGYCVVLEFVPVRVGWKHFHATPTIGHKTISWYLLGVLFKSSPFLFIWESPRRLFMHGSDLPGYLRNIRQETMTVSWLRSSVRAVNGASFVPPAPQCDSLAVHPILNQSSGFSIRSFATCACLVGL